MTLEKKLGALKRIYALYDQHTRHLQIACQKYCAHCCTCNVVMTSLEAANIYQALPETDRAAVRHTLAPRLAKNRYLPEITINRMAALCANGEAPPEEAIDPGWGSCPLLENMACPVYTVRPFGCRCLLSTRDCDATGYAEIDDYTITVNYLFSQFIEHLDQDGSTGNLTDMLLAADAENGKYPPDFKALPAGCHLIQNRPIPLLLIPPAHQKDIAALVDELHVIIAAA